MKVALSINNHRISDHFGHCEYFVVYEVENNEIMGNQVMKTPPHEKGLIPKFLKNHDVDVVIAGGIGKMAVDLLNSFGITCYIGVSGEANEVIEKYLKGELKSTEKPCEDHQGNC